MSLCEQTSRYLERNKNLFSRQNDFYNTLSSMTYGCNLRRRLCSTHRPSTRATVVPATLTIFLIGSPSFQIELTGTSELTTTLSPMQQLSPTWKPLSTRVLCPNSTPSPKLVFSSSCTERSVVHRSPIVTSFSNTPDSEQPDPIVTFLPVTSLLKMPSPPIWLLLPKRMRLLKADCGPTTVSLPTNVCEKLCTALRPWNITPESRNSRPLIVLPPNNWAPFLHFTVPETVFGSLSRIVHGPN